MKRKTTILIQLVIFLLLLGMPEYDLTQSRYFYQSYSRQKDLLAPSSPLPQNKSKRNKKTLKILGYLHPEDWERIKEEIVLWHRVSVEAWKSRKKSKDESFIRGENRRWGIYFLKGNIYRRDEIDSVTFEFDPPFQKMEDTSSPRAGSMYTAVDQSGLSLVWRSLDFNQKPPSRILVTSTSPKTLEGVKILLKQRGYDKVPVVPSKGAFLKPEAFYHTTKLSYLGWILGYGALLSPMEQFPRFSLVRHVLRCKMGYSINEWNEPTKRSALDSKVSAIIQSWYATEEWKNLGEVIELLFTLVDTYERMGGSTRAQKWLDKEIQLLISQSSNTTITVKEEKRDGQMNIAL